MLFFFVSLNSFNKGYYYVQQKHREDIYAFYKSKFFSDTSLDREKSENHNVIHFIAFALKGKVVIKEKLVLAVLYVIN